MPHLTFDAMVDALEDVFRSAGVPAEGAAECARVVTQSTFDGVFSHGVRIVPTLLEWLESGQVDAAAVPECVYSGGALERWDGRHGIGVLNALRCTDRAVALAAETGIGCVALRNTSHWFRAGTYAWRAVDAGFGLMCWTNTLPNMPAWGAVRKSVGNNPLAIGVPHGETPLVLDIAMSQFALGALRVYRDENRDLPIPGGYDSAGELTTDPAAVIESERVLPTGFWKGSGLALVLDALAALLSDGSSTPDLAAEGVERSVSQVFLAFDVRRGGSGEGRSDIVADIVGMVHAAANESHSTYAPGEGALKRRKENMERGIDVDDELWERIRSCLC